MARILVVDDDRLVAYFIRRVLENEGYEVSMAADGQQALDSVASSPPDLVLLDLDMPVLGGYDVCRQLKSDPATRFVPVLILTGRDASDDRLHAWDLGADDYLIKPFRAVEVLARCKSLLRVKRLTDELDSAESVVFAFARAVEAKSVYTRGHSDRVADYALAMAHALGVSESDLHVLRRGALLHDVGKLNVPDAILNKPGRLTVEEYDIIKQHPYQGVRILESLRSVRETLPLVRWHHERLDGRGYPDGLFAGSIPPLVRMLSVADVYDALSSARPYRPAWPHARCLEVLQQDADSGGFDPEFVRCFCKVISGPVPAVPCDMPGFPCVT